jgi:hypothetical protein
VVLRVRFVQQGRTGTNAMAAAWVRHLRDRTRPGGHSTSESSPPYACGVQRRGGRSFRWLAHGLDLFWLS